MSRKSTSNYYSISNLQFEWKMSPDSKGDGKSAGIDGIWPKEFTEKLDYNLYRIREDIITDNFGYRKLKVFGIEKEGKNKRVICVPTVRDRLVQRLVIRLLTKDATPNKKHLKKKLELENNPIMFGLG